MTRWLWLTPAFFIGLLPHLATAQLRSIETDDLRLVFYSRQHTYLAPQLMRSFQNALDFHRRLFHYRPSEKTSVLLEDFGDYGHGGADVIPSDRITLGIAPFNYAYETMPANERMSWIMNHELAHVAAMDGASGSDRFFRRMLGGKVSPNPEDPVSMAYGFLTTPRRYSPRWYHEGLATFLETWMSGGLGRALGGYDEMVFRTMVRDDSHIYDAVGLEAEGTTIDFQVGVNSYLYGTRFMTYLTSEYGPQKLMEWVRRNDGSHLYFATQFRSVYGRPLTEEWSRWISAERKWQNANLSLLRQYPVTPLRRISDHALGSVSRAYYDAQTGKLYAALRSTGQMANLAAIDRSTGEISHMHDVEGPALFYVCGLAFDPEGRKLYYTSANNDWRGLHVFDLATSRATRLIENFRAGDLAFSNADRVLWAVRHGNGFSSLVEVAPPYTEATQLVEFPYGTDIFDLDVSPDGEWLTAALADSTGRQKLVKFRTGRLRAKDGTFEVIHDFDFSSPANFVFSPDGRYLYGTSYYTGASNIFRFETATGTMDVLSNSETGLFRPLPMADGRLLAFEYTAKGFIPVEVEAKPIQDVSAVKYLGQQVIDKYPEVKNWKLPPPSNIDIAGLTRGAGVYRAWEQMRLRSVYPIVQGYRDSQAYGLRADISDGFGLAALDLTASYSPDSSLEVGERAHAAFQYRNWGWKLSGSYNYADFYDLFGPTKNSRKGYALKLEHKQNLLYRPPRTLELSWNVAGYAGLDRLPDYQNVTAPFTKFLTGWIALNYSRVEKSLGAVDDEKGIRWQISSRGNYVRSGFLPRVYGSFDYGFLTPINNSPVWIRSSLGQSFGDRTNPFANFYFGGFGNNWVDHLETSRYREYYSFPGVPLDQVGATNFGKTLIEWNLPPIRFRHVGTTFLYCNWARFTLFSSALAGNLASAPNRVVYVNAGSQLDLRMVLFSYLNSTFSAGYAEAADHNGRLSHEVMVSLKLL